MLDGKIRDASCYDFQTTWGIHKGFFKHYIIMIILVGSLYNIMHEINNTKEDLENFCER